MNRRSTVFWGIALAAGLATALALAAGPLKSNQTRKADMSQQAIAARMAQADPAPLDQAQPAAFATATFALG